VNAMWKSFLTSIGLLTIALVAALYSSNAARDGRGVAAGISAVVALVIAVWVGIKFVPRLASHVDWEWLPFLTHYHITREGWIYFGGLLIVVFAAVNTSNNLLYIVLSALLAFVVLSGFLSGLNFKSVRAIVRIPGHCYAGEPFPITIQVRNEKTLFPTFSISFEPAKASAFSFSTFYIPLVRGLEKISRTEQAILPARGHFKLQHIKGSSRYPFGFFRKDRNYPVEAECLCYPEILPKEQVNLAATDVGGSNERFARGLGQDLYMIRDYIPSDSARHVHWKASAKTSTLKTREYAVEEVHRVTIAFDRFGHAAHADRFEQQVSMAASLAYHLANDGIELNFITDDWQGNKLESILDYLALVEMSSSAERPTADDDAVKLSLRT